MTNKSRNRRSRSGAVRRSVVCVEKLFRGMPEEVTVDGNRTTAAHPGGKVGVMLGNNAWSDLR
jgi:hypothetical protein